MATNQLTQEIMEAFNERYTATAYIKSLAEQQLYLNFHEDSDNELLYEDLTVFNESNVLVIHQPGGEVCRFDLSETNDSDQEVLERVILHWYNHNNFDICIN